MIHPTVVVTLGSKVTFYGYENNRRTCTFEGFFMLTSWDVLRHSVNTKDLSHSMKIFHNFAILFYCNFCQVNYLNINNVMNTYYKELESCQELQ